MWHPLLTFTNDPTAPPPPTPETPTGGGGGKKNKRRVIKYSDFAHQEDREMAFRAAIAISPAPIPFEDDEEDDDEILLMTLARLFH